MIKWIFILAIVALIAGALGFRGVSSVAGKGALLFTAVLLAFVAVVLLLFAWAGGGVL